MHASRLNSKAGIIKILLVSLVDNKNLAAGFKSRDTFLLILAIQPGKHFSCFQKFLINKLLKCTDLFHYYSKIVYLLLKIRVLSVSRQ